MTMKSGKVIRSDVAEVKRTGRNTQGVTLAKPDKGDEILSIARNAEKDEADQETDGAPPIRARSSPRQLPWLHRNSPSPLRVPANPPLPTADPRVTGNDICCDGRCNAAHPVGWPVYKGW